MTKLVLFCINTPYNEVGKRREEQYEQQDSDLCSRR